VWQSRRGIGEVLTRPAGRSRIWWQEPEGAVRQCGRRNFRVMAARPARLVGGAMRTVRYGALNGGAKGALIGTEK